MHRRWLKTISYLSLITLLTACGHLGQGQRVGAKSEAGTSPNRLHDQLHRLFAAEWQQRTKQDPFAATRAGIEGYADQLPDVSPQAINQWAKQSELFLEQLRQIDYSKLSRDDKANYRIFEEQLTYRVSQARFKAWQIPFLSDYGFHTAILNLADEQSFSSPANYQHYFSRLSKIPAYFDQQISNMKAGLSRGFSMPKVVMDGFTDVIQYQIDRKLDDNPFWRPLKKLPKHFSEKEKKMLTEEARQIITKDVQPAFKRLKNFFEKEYIPAARNSIGASEVPDGLAWYQAQIKHYTTLDLTPDEIHQIGLSEVKRIRGEMTKVIRSTGFKGDFKSFLRFLRNDPRFYARTPEALLKEASFLAKKIDGQLPRFFTRLPRQPYTVEAVPADIAPKYTTGRYVGAPIDSTRPGKYWVNTFALNKRPLYVLPSLTLHEAVPGHHLQTALSQELGDLPEFRRESYISAFGEGWALYCEKLGLEMGLYNDPYANFGRLTYEMWRAARLVIDTGIHAKGWTRQQAIRLLEENSALSTHNIRTEVDRYISWPGQALSYKLGELKILKLRRTAEKALADKFDLRRFHDAVLANGSVPLNVLEEQINQFIATEKASSFKQTH